MRPDEAHNLRAFFSGPDVSHGGLFCLECRGCPQIPKPSDTLYHQTPKGTNMFKRGDIMEILEEFQDPGDNTFTWMVLHDEEKGRRHHSHQHQIENQADLHTQNRSNKVGRHEPSYRKNAIATFVETVDLDWYSPRHSKRLDHAPSGFTLPSTAP